jgi:hypothetical protein
MKPSQKRQGPAGSAFRMAGGGYALTTATDDERVKA